MGAVSKFYRSVRFTFLVIRDTFLDEYVKKKKKKKKESKNDKKKLAPTIRAFF